MPLIYILNRMAICEDSQDTKFRTYFSVTLDVHFRSCFIISPFFERIWCVHGVSHEQNLSWRLLSSGMWRCIIQ